MDIITTTTSNLNILLAILLVSSFLLMYFVRNWLFLLHSGMEILTTKHMPSKWTVLVQNGGQSSVIVSNRVRTWPPSCCILVKGYIWCQKKQKYVMFICMATTHEIFTKPYLEIAMYAAKWLAQRRWQIEVLALISSIVQIVLCSLYWVFLQIKSIVNVQIVIFFSQVPLLPVVL